MLDALIGGGLGLVGGILGNNSAKKASKQQMKFQKAMRDTQYQAAVEDLKKAGLNPMLAYSQGGNAAPSGATYKPENIGDATVSSAVASKRASNESQIAAETVKNLKVTNAKTAADANTSMDQGHLNRALAKKAMAETLTAASTAQQIQTQNRILSAQVPRAEQQKHVDQSWIGRNLPYFDRTMESLGRLNPFVSSASSAKRSFGNH